MAKQPYISADDIHQLFYQQGRKRRLPSWQLISAAILIVFGVFILLNAPAVGQQIGYWWQSDIQANRLTSQLVNLSTDQPTELTSKPVNQLTSLPNSTIYIPKIGVRAPIIWDVSAGGDLNEDLLKALQHGVARYPKTALPDQIGNVFLTGHSSNYWWDKGRYKTIFVLLNRLVVGDVIYLKYQNILYTYRVSGQKIVQPADTSVLAPTKTSTLSLMTCTPTGTSLLRRIVTADLLSPAAQNQQPTTPDATSLQSIR